MQSFEPSGSRPFEGQRETPQDEAQPHITASDTDDDRREILRIVKMGYDACFWGDKESFDPFLAAISGPFKGQGNHTQEQRRVLKALNLLLDSLRLDTETQDAERGLVSALGFTRGVLSMESDSFEALEADFPELSSCLFSILRDERFQPSRVLEGDSETRIAIAFNALSTFFACRDFSPLTKGVRSHEEPLAQELASAGLHSALGLLHSGVLETASDDIVDLKLSVIRELGNMALCFPSTSLAEPLLEISRVCSIQCQQGSLLFPDIVEDDDNWDGEYDSIEDGGEDWKESDVYVESEDGNEAGTVEAGTIEHADGIWRASMSFDQFGGEYEAIAAVCLSALVYCQSGDSLQAIWERTLEKLEPQDTEWCSALVGLSLVNPEQIRMYLRGLFDTLSQTSTAKDAADRFSPRNKREIAMNALLELLAGNEQAGIQVQVVYRNLPPVEKATVASWVKGALDSGEVEIFNDSRGRQMSLEDQLRFIFGLNESNGADGAGK